MADRTGPRSAIGSSRPFGPGGRGGLAPPFLSWRATIAAMALLLAYADGAPAQATADTVSPATPKRGSQLLIPASSLILPGLGQYLHGAWGPGLAFTGSAAAGLWLSVENGQQIDPRDLPREPKEQLGTSGLLLASGASFVSVHDAFQRSIPALQRQGKYTFLDRRDRTTDLFTAPFDPEFLGRWTTWAHLAYTGTLVGIVLSEREAGTAYEPLDAGDVGFATTLSLSAAIGEEAAFRGWLLPLFHQTFGERFWLSNGLQSLLFGAGHVESAAGFAAAIGGWAFYEGWLTRRNGWSIRESVFHHFWYDVAVVTATFLTDERARVAVTFPTIRF